MIQNNAKFWFLILLSGVLFFASCKSSRKSISIGSGKVSKVEKKGSMDCDKVVEVARSYIGTPYKYGGTTRAGMDCSGLMFTSFKSINKSLPRTSSAQSELGKKVAIDEIQVGDLVFFTDRKGRKKVTHVGMVTEVRGDKDIKFIHSSTKLGVVESNLFVEYYYKLFLYAVRILN